MENVKALLQKKFLPEFKAWLQVLDDLGYATFYQVLNAKDYGVAQNRERVFAVSILRDNEKPNSTYHFPFTFALDKCVEDYMEPVEDIGREYYIDRNRIKQKVLSDIFEQPHVLAEMEKLYHEEWRKKGISLR